MEKGTDWIRLWRELAETQSKSWKRDGNQDADRLADTWRNKARGFHANTKRRWAQPDSSQTFIVNWLQAHPGASVLDIGAGTGAWSMLLAQYARLVTAVDPSPAMIEVLEENLAVEGIGNVQIVRGTWPDVAVEPHDMTLCSHAMYGSPDLPAFVRRMMEVTRRTCFLVLRAPTADGVMAEAAMQVRGQPHDSPNFQVAYNALLQMGILANVLMEDSGFWPPWISDSLEEARGDIKRRLGLDEGSEYDASLAGLLRRRLTYQDGRYVWPPGVRSALVYWNVAG